MYSTVAILFSFFIALLITLLPFPPLVEWLQPPWVLLALIYWTVNFPHRIGLIFTWIIALFLDVLSGNSLGQSAIPFLVTAYLGIKFSQQIRMFPIGQQAFTVMILLVVHRMLAFWIEGFLQHPPQTLWYWLPCITGPLFWPFIYSMLRWFQRHWKID